MPASDNFRKTTIKMLKSIIADEGYDIIKEDVKHVDWVYDSAHSNHRKYFELKTHIRYVLAEKNTNKRIFSIKKAIDVFPGTRSISLTICDKSLWGEFLDSELESLYKCVENEYKERSKKTKEKPEISEEMSSLGKDQEQKIVHLLKQSFVKTN